MAALQLGASLKMAKPERQEGIIYTRYVSDPKNIPFVTQTLHNSMPARFTAFTYSRPLMFTLETCEGGFGARNKDLRTEGPKGLWSL